MKTSWVQSRLLQVLKTLLTCVFVGAGLLPFVPFSRAQEMVQEETPPLPPPLNLPLATTDAATNGGTFWSLQISNSAPLPFNPFPDLTVYDLGGGQFIFDDRTVNYVVLEEQRQVEKALLRATALSLGPAVEEDESGGGMMMSTLYTTNDLWLEIIGVTNLEFSSTSDLVIHPPEAVTNEVYDLYFRTNLNLDPAFTFSQQWSRIQRTTPGQTNLVVTNLPPEQGFFTLGPITNAIRPGFTDNFLERNDDDYCCDQAGIGTSGTQLTNLLATLAFPINFFGSTNTSLYVNNNGNVTFEDFLPTWTPGDLTSLGIRIIAPFWADVDTRNTNSDVVRFGTNIVDGHRAFGVEWVNVGYYATNADRLLSCQLVIIDRSDIATNDFDMEFNYDRVEWEWGDASTGVPPRAGYSDGVTNSYELPGSGVGSAFLDTNFDTGLIYHSLDGPKTNLLSSPVSGRYHFVFRNGVPLP
jgi:hypothetical protein